VDDAVDLVADLNAEDDDGLGWSTLSDAVDPRRVQAGSLVLAGNRQAQAVVRITAVTRTARSTSRFSPARWRRTAISSHTRSPDHRLGRTPVRRLMSGRL
jgi:hypothetical protein